MNQPAFPVSFKWGEELSQYNGTTLRDYFAAKAMQGLLTAEIVGEYSNEHVANIAYQIADAMMKVREL